MRVNDVVKKEKGFREKHLNTQIKFEGGTMRAILFAGKGVGKTAVAAATAALSAEMGHRTLIISTDPNRCLSAFFGTKLSSEPGKLANNLYGLEINDVTLHDELVEWKDMIDYATGVSSFGGMGSEVSTEMLIRGGIKEVSGIVKIGEYSKVRQFDVCILDAELVDWLIGFLTIPYSADWYMKRYFKRIRRLSRLAGLFNWFLSIPTPPDRVFDDVEELYERIKWANSALSDSHCGSVRLTMDSDKFSVRDARQFLSYLNLFEFRTDFVTANEVCDNGAERREEIESSFSTIPVSYIELDEMPAGVKQLRRVAKKVYGNRDPTRVFCKDKFFEVMKKDGGYVLSINADFEDKQLEKKILLSKDGNELIVEAGKKRLIVGLPYVLSASEPKKAVIEHGRLVVRFD